MIKFEYCLSEIILLTKPNDAIHLKIVSTHRVIAHHMDDDHAHYLIDGTPTIADKFPEHILISHAYRERKSCIQRIQNQPAYHKLKSLVSEIEDLFDFLEISTEENDVLLLKSEIHGRQNVSHSPKNLNHAIPTG